MITRGSLLSFFRPGWLLLLLAAAAVLPARAQTSGNDESDRAARRILQRWIEVIGGGEELRTLKSVVYRCKVSTETMAPFDFCVRSTAGGQYRCEYQIPGAGELIQAFDGAVAWQQNLALGFGLQSATEHQMNRIMADFRTPLRVAQLYPRRKLLPNEVIGGVSLQVLEMGGADGRREKWYFDPKSGYRVRVEVLGQMQPLIVDFADFRKAYGAAVMEPFLVLRHEAGQKLEVRVESILYNEEMDPALFAVSPGRLDDNREIDRLLFYNAQVMGLAAVQQIRSRITEQAVKVTTSGVTIASKTYNKHPNLLLVEQDVPGLGPTWRGFDGKVGWAWSEVQGYREMQGPELRQILGETDLAGPMKLAAQCPLRRLLGEETSGGRTLVGVALATAQGPAGNFYFDRKTFELARVETEVQAGQSGKLKITAEYFDYRPVDGVLIPYRSVFTNPAMRMEVMVTAVQQNVEIDDALFVPRRE
jgi:hypothetical protein